MAKESATHNVHGRIVVSSVIAAGLLFAAPQLAAAETETDVSTGQTIVATQMARAAAAQTGKATGSGANAGATSASIMDAGNNDDKGAAAASTATTGATTATVQTTPQGTQATKAPEAATADNSAGTGTPVPSTGTSATEVAPSANGAATSTYATGQAAAPTRTHATAAALAAQATTATRQTARIGAKTYASLADAIAASTNGQTVTLVDDVNDLSQHLVISGKSIVFDGAGHTIRRSANYTGEFFYVEKDGTLTLRNVILDGDGSGWYVDYAHGSIKDTTPGISSVPIAQGTAKVNSTGRMVTNRGTLTLDKATLKDAYSTKVGGVLLYSAPGSKLTIKGGTVFRNAYSPDAPVLVDGNVDFLVDGATFDRLASGGGGLHILSSATDTMPVIRHATFSNCFSGFNGGSLYCERNAVQIYDSTFENSTTCNDGGSICMTPGVKHSTLFGGTSTFKNVRFINSRGLSPYNQSLGSAVFLHLTYGGAYVFEDCLFRGCAGCAGAVTDYGGGKLGEGGLMPMTFTRCTFDGNKASGGVAIDARTLDVVLDDCKIINNVAAYQGGAISLEDSSRCTLGKGTIITNNHAGNYGGGVRFYGNNVFTMQAGSKLYGNTAGTGGDDIYSGNGTDYAPTITLIKGADMHAYTKDGHAIDGWYVDMVDGVEKGVGRYQRNVSAEQETLTIHTAGFVTLKADASTFTVSYNPNAIDAQGTMEPEEFGMSDVATLRKNVFTRAGWRFAGWALAKDGAVALEDGESLTNTECPDRGGTLVLYAVWEKAPADQPQGNPAKPTPAPTATHAAKASPASAITPRAKSYVSKHAASAKELPATGDDTGTPVAATTLLGGILAALGIGARKREG